MTKIGVLAVQGAVSEHLEHLQRCDVEALAVKTAASLKKVAGLIIPGGESTTIGKLIETFGLAPAIRARGREKSLAIFGTCAGMVLIARKILDGAEDQYSLDLMDIEVKRNAFGRQRESFETSLAFADFAEPMTGVFIRAPLIINAGPAVTVLSTLPEGIVAARQDNMLSVSFHPELTDDLRVHRYFVTMCEEI